LFFPPNFENVDEFQNPKLTDISPCTVPNAAASASSFMTEAIPGNKKRAADGRNIPTVLLPSAALLRLF